MLQVAKRYSLVSLHVQSQGKPQARGLPFSEGAGCGPGLPRPAEGDGFRRQRGGPFSARGAPPVSPRASPAPLRHGEEKPPATAGPGLGPTCQKGAAEGDPPAGGRRPRSRGWGVPAARGALSN